jgi:hypothetical protein
MALLVPQQITRSGIVPTLAAVAASDTFVPPAKGYLQVANGGGGTTTVTVTSVGTDQYGFGSPSTDLIVTVAAGATKKIYLGDDASQRFTNPTTAVATVTCSPTTSVTIGVFSI